MKKILITNRGPILFAALFALLFAINSCIKKESSSFQNGQEIKLSQAILDYDNVVKSQKSVMAWTEKDTKQLLVVATADLKSSWEAFKLVSKFLTPGYGGAAALLAGIGGSLYTWWLTKEDAQIAKIDNPNTTVPNSVSPLNIGKWHNHYMHQELISGTGNSKNLDSMVDNTYNVFLSNVAKTFNYSIQDLSLVITKTDYKEIVNESSKSYTIEELYAHSIADGYSVTLANYYKEFLMRAANPDNFTYERAIEYTDLFISDVDRQTALTQSEKDQMKTAISVYQNSLKYWYYTLK